MKNNLVAPSPFTSLQFKVTPETLSCDAAENIDESFTFVKTPQLLNQRDLNDLVRDFRLTKEKSDILLSRLKSGNLLQ